MHCRIFLSYGHDEYAELARKLKDDLEKRGHEVWFDEEQLHPGEDWEVYIERGIEWVAGDPVRGRIVLLMTPHSVRRPDGYCLNELSRALSRGLRVVPIMVVWVEPPLSICRIQWLDLRDCIPLDARPGAYSNKLDRLTAAIEYGQIDFEGVQARLMTLLDPLPFDVEVNEHLARFTGREWIFTSIDGWLADPSAKIFWITGPPGIGKTALATKLLSTRPEVVAVHLCQSGHTQKSDSRRCVLSIAYQLSTQLPEYEHRLNALPLHILIAESDARTLFDRLILQPLSANFPDPSRVLVVLIDALDEATRDGLNPLASCLANEFPKTPPWLRLIITSRPDPEVMYPLQAISPYVIDASARENEADIRAFLQRELRSHLLDTHNATAVVDTIVDRSEGNFLYVEWLRREIGAGRMTLAQVETLPKGLGGVYARFVERQWPDINAFKQHIAPGLDMISAAREPLPLSLLAEINGWTERQQHEFQMALGSLFTLADAKVNPFHKSLLDWLTNRTTAGPYFISSADGSCVLAEYCWRRFQQNPLALPSYVVRHLPAHMIAEKRWDSLGSVLTNLAFLETKIEGDGIFSVAADFAAAISALPLGQPLEQTLRLLEEAIRRDLHFISKHPTTLFQCLWNLCWWYDCPEAIHHYSPRVETASSAMEHPWDRPGPKLYQLLERWREDKEARQPGFIWVRSLRPPPVPLGAAHMVLGGHSDTIHVVSVSSDGRRLISGSSDNTVRLWDTRTGVEQLICKAGAPVYAAAISPDGQKIAAVPVVSKSVILWDAATGNILHTLAYEKEVHCVAFSPSGSLLATGADDATTIVWNVASGKQLAVLRGMRNRIESVAFSPDGILLLAAGGWGVHDDQYIRIWDWRSERELRCISAHKSLLHRALFSPDGRRIASCAGDAMGEYTIKIWETINGPLPLIMNGHTNSVDDIGFSPDGSKLVSGSWDETVRLWDTATGTALCAVDIGNKVNCVGFLPDGRRIYSAGYDNVVRIWDGLAAGSLPPARPDNDDNIWRLAYSPDGRILATGSERGAVVFWDAETGQRKGQISPWVPGPVSNMAFSPDSLNLAVTTGHVPWEDEDVPWHGRYDYDIRIFDVASMMLVATLSGHAHKVEPRGLHYSAQGRAIVSPLDSGPIWLWDARRYLKIEELTEDRAAEVRVARLKEPANIPDRVKARLQTPETVFTDGATGREIAWFALPLHELTPHPSGQMWAGRSDDVNAHGNEACKLEMVAIEGAVLLAHT